MELNIADIIIIATILVSTGIGIYRGFIREFFTILTWIIAAVVAYMFGKSVGDYLVFIDNAYTQEIVGMIIVFLVGVLIGMVVKGIVCKIAKISAVKPVDRLTGALFGALRGCLLIVLVLYLSSANITKQDWYKKSQLVPSFAQAATLIPAGWKQDFKQEADDFMHKEQAPAPVTTANPTSNTTAANANAPASSAPATPSTNSTTPAANATTDKKGAN